MGPCSLVICEDGQPRPVPGVRLALVHGDSVIPLQVSASGSFQSDNIAPTQYDIVVDPTSLPAVTPADIPKITIDLTHDVLGFVIRIRCGDRALAKPREEPQPQHQPAVVQPASEENRFARYDRAVALYETGEYAEAKREIAGAEIPDTLEARRYVAKIAGAIVP